MATGPGYWAAHPCRTRGLERARGRYARESTPPGGSIARPLLATLWPEASAVGLRLWSEQHVGEPRIDPFGSPTGRLSDGIVVSERSTTTHDVTTRRDAVAAPDRVVGSGLCWPPRSGARAGSVPVGPPAEARTWRFRCCGTFCRGGQQSLPGREGVRSLGPCSSSLSLPSYHPNDSWGSAARGPAHVYRGLDQRHFWGGDWPGSRR